ncbi:MAG: hypothetical protein ACFE9Z_04420 [Promethearchaeota archaeon]
MDLKEILKKCQLNEIEMNEYLEMTKNIDHKKDHSLAYRTMMNPIRRDLLKYIGTDMRTFEQILGNFELEEDQIRYHLSMLEQLVYVMNTERGWIATPRGIGFIYNAIMG